MFFIPVWCFFENIDEFFCEQEKDWLEKSIEFVFMIKILLQV